MIEPKYNVLQSLFADRVFRIPYYQRFYSWQQRQRDELFDDLRRLAEKVGDQHHFMATIVCHRTVEVRDIGATQYRIYDMVDGQQRLTTLIILLKCIELALPNQSEERADLARTLVKRDGHLILLQTNNANEYSFNRFIREGTEPTESDILTYSDRNLYNAIRETRTFVKSWMTSQNILSLMRLILHRLGFVVFDTEDSRSVHTIFEVLNSRGLAVDWLDKTKSVMMGRMYEMSKSAESAQAEIGTIQGIWGDIYREIAKADVPGDETLRMTATLYYGPGQGKPRSAEESLDLIRQACSSFEQPQKISRRLLDVARQLVEIYDNVRLDAVTKILHARLLAVAIKLTTSIIKDEQEKLLEQWERTAFRIFGLFGKDARTKVGDFVQLSHKIVNGTIDMRTPNEIMRALRNLGRDYPVDQAIVEGLIHKDIYARPEDCRYILWSYEEHLAQVLGASSTVDLTERAKIWALRASESIEHIRPQNMEAPGWKDNLLDYGLASGNETTSDVGRIGNLILLPLKLNQEARDSAFSLKKQIYNKHNLRMVEAVCSNNDWGIAEVENREAAIVAWARERWADI